MTTWINGDKTLSDDNNALVCLSGNVDSTSIVLGENDDARIERTDSNMAVARAWLENNNDDIAD